MNTTGSDTIDTVSCVANDLLSVQVIRNGGTANAIGIVSFEFS